MAAGLLAAVVLAAMPVLAARPAAPQAEAGPVVQVGAGSYATRSGGRGDPIPGPNFKGPYPTEQWFTNLIFKGKNCNTMFPLPLEVQPSGSGLAIGYPGSFVRMPKGGDISLTGDQGTYNDVALDGYSDWFIKVAFTSGGKGMHVTYGHGSPFVYATFDSGGAVVNCGGATVWANQGAVQGITVGRVNYGLFGPTGSTWTNAGGKFTNTLGGKGYVSVAALPDATPATLALFKKYAYAHVTDTQVAYKLDETGAMKVTYTFTTKPYEGTEKGTITALFPHQWKYTNEKLSTLTTLVYPTVRGDMKVVTGPSGHPADAAPGGGGRQGERGRFRERRSRHRRRRHLRRGQIARQGGQPVGRGRGRRRHRHPAGLHLQPEAVPGGLAERRRWKK
jgi:endoglucanase Acf2